jgi:hypothetical protein
LSPDNYLSSLELEEIAALIKHLNVNGPSELLVKITILDQNGDSVGYVKSNLDGQYVYSDNGLDF